MISFYCVLVIYKKGMECQTEASKNFSTRWKAVNNKRWIFYVREYL